MCSTQHLEGLHSWAEHCVLRNRERMGGLIGSEWSLWNFPAKFQFPLCQDKWWRFMVHVLAYPARPGAYVRLWISVPLLSNWQGMEIYSPIKNSHHLPAQRVPLLEDFAVSSDYQSLCSKPLSVEKETLNLKSEATWCPYRSKIKIQYFHTPLSSFSSFFPTRMIITKCWGLVASKLLLVPVLENGGTKTRLSAWLDTSSSLQPAAPCWFLIGKKMNKRALWCCFYKTQIPFMRGVPSWFKYLSKTPSPNAITLEK